jgi:hypothetical protein
MPFYQADASNASAKAEVTRLMERITEAMAAVACNFGKWEYGRIEAPCKKL